jgi:uncharacterized membrane protein YbhN (UPF0104 family)
VPLRARTARLAERLRGPAGSVVGAVAVAAVLVVVLRDQKADFLHALDAAPVWLLAIAALLQLVALLSRTEAWHGCVGAAGATITRRPLYRASSMGCFGTLLNTQLGTVARIAALRRSSPDDTPRIPALVGAELPIFAVEAGLAALFSFTLIGPLGLPWWVPVLAIAVIGALVAGLGEAARRGRRSLFRGLAVLRSPRGRVRLALFVMIAVFAQIARNYLMLHAVGVPISVFDSIALLIAMVTLGQLPLGPSVGAAAAVVVLGPSGMALVTAAGVLLTVTGTLAALSFAGWGALDAVLPSRYPRKGGLMPHLMCRTCRLRFHRPPHDPLDTALGAEPCPHCGEPLSAVTDLRRLVGLRAADPEDGPARPNPGAAWGTLRVQAARLPAPEPPR